MPSSANEHCRERDLQDKDDDEKEPVGGQQDPGLLYGPAVAQEGDDEDEGPGRDQDVGALLDHRGLGELLKRVGQTVNY